MTPAYKHLDSKLRIAELSVGQWVGVLAGLVVGIGWGFYLSPLGVHLTLFTAVYLAALPVGAALLAGTSELDVGLTLRAAGRWLRSDGRYLAGPGSSVRGYVVRPAWGAEDRRPAHAPMTDLAGLWDA